MASTAKGKRHRAGAAGTAASKRPSRQRHLRAVFLIAALVAAVSVQLHAQASGATLSVVAKSASGVPIGDAHVAVRNAAGQAQPVSVNADGTCTVSGLSPGTYEITASAPGYAQAQEAVTVARVGTQVAELVLHPSQSAAADPEQAESAGNSGMGAKGIGELPLNGRSASDVAGLEPGVIKTRTQAGGGGINGFGKQMAIFGGRPRQNGSYLDGISVSDYANGPQGNAIGISLGVDALERLSVLTRNDQAEYGRSSGGYISSTTRSGTNSFHGTVFYYFRNSALDASNYFDQEKPPFHRSQFGAAMGGPIWKDHTFIFGDYEGIRQSQGLTRRSSVPSAAARGGQLCSQPDGTCTPTTITVDPAATAYLDAFYPLPNAGLLGNGDTGVLISSGQKITPGNHFTARLDHKVSDKDSLYGIYLFDSGTVTQPDRMNNKLTGYDSREQFFTFGHTHDFSPRLINSFRFGIYRVVTNTGITSLLNNPAVADPSLGAVPGLNASHVDVTGISSFSGGLGALGQYHFHWTSIQAYDDISLIRGNHSMKFGVSVERMRNNILAISDPTGRYRFNSLSDFLTNQPSSVSVALPGTLSERGLRQTVVGAYIQDEWRMRPNFSLDLGLRYEMATVPTDAQNRLSTLRNLTDPQPHLGSPLFSNPTLHNFEPRVGFAWDPFRSGKTIVSSGFGIFDVLPLPYEFQFGEIFAAPYFKSGEVSDLPAGSFPTGGFDLAAASTNSYRQTYIEPHPKRNYVMQWNFTIQRVLPKGVNLKVGYVGSHGVHHLVRVLDADIVLPTVTPDGGYLWPSPAGSGERLNPNVGRINGAFWEGSSSYNALVVQVRSRLGRRAQISGSYTWGRSIDTTSASIGGAEYRNAISSPLWFALPTNRGLSDFNVSQDLKIIYSWQLPRPRLPMGLATWALDGWQIGGVFEASTGVPFTPGIGGDPLGVNSTDPGLDVPNVLSGPGCESLVNHGDPTHYIKTQCFSVPNPITLRGNLGRNRLIGPGLVNLDFSVFKNNYVRRISDTFNVQFRAEIFNIMNHPNFRAPLTNKNIFDSQGNPVGSAGLIDSTQGSARQIQLAVKFNW